MTGSGGLPYWLSVKTTEFLAFGNRLKRDMDSYALLQLLNKTHVCFTSTSGQSILHDLFSLAHDCIQMRPVSKTFSVDLVYVLSA